MLEAWRQDTAQEFGNPLVLELGWARKKDKDSCRESGRFRPRRGFVC